MATKRPARTISPPAFGLPGASSEAAQPKTEAEGRPEPWEEAFSGYKKLHNRDLQSMRRRIEGLEKSVERLVALLERADPRHNVEQPLSDKELQ